MKFKMLCTDIDGTLLNKQRELSAATIYEIKKIKDLIPVVLISSRMPKAMKHLQEELDILDHPLIAYNGGLITYKDEVLESTEIDISVLEKLIEYSSKTSIHISLYNNDSWYVPQMDYWAQREINNTKVNPILQPISETLNQWKATKNGAHKIMCMGAENEIDFLFKKLEDEHFDDIILYRSKPTYIEIANKKISKETAIKTLLSNIYPEIGMQDILAFGDNYNDIEMLKAVGIGVAVENAKEEVKKVAKDVTKKNIDDGVAFYIQKHFSI